MSQLWKISALVLAVVLAGLAQPQTPDPVAVARQALDLLLAGQYTQLRELFNPQMLQAATEESLRTTVGSMIQSLGKPVNIGEPIVQHVQNMTIVIFPVQFPHGDPAHGLPPNLNVLLPVDPTGKLAGLRFTPTEPPPQAQQQWTPAAYVNPAAFHNRQVTVGEGQWRLPGTLSIPNGPGPFPAVVLVQGSGPHDRDETVGANKPFRDIAEGLASRGIAVLRYDKRTLVYGPQMAAIPNFTVNQETIDDALKALALLRSQPEINQNRIFLLGHSLGGYLAPRIAEEAPYLAGVIIMAGTTRPIEDVMLEQMRYLGAPPAQIAQVQQQAQEIHNLKSAEGPPILNAPRSYWLDLNNYNPEATVGKLHCRILVLQGARDYQVTQSNYAGWQAALKNDPKATFHLYPSLNHLFIAGQGPSTPAEYERPGHVAPEVINDIATWIKQQP